MKKLRFILLVIITALFSVLISSLNCDATSYYGAQKVYRVYLNGVSVGLIKSKTELENYINKEQQAIKEKYKVEEVHIPQGLEIKQELTYNEKIDNTKEIYEKIKNEESFTIEGYKFTIIENNSKAENYVYALDANIVKNAIDNVIVSFIDEEQYANYLTKNQQEITDEGELIENVYLGDQVKYKKEYIPVNKEIFTDEKELTSYLLFGTTDIQKTYKVQAGETISTIADRNKLSSEEFLVANRDLSSETSLLYEGQEVVIGLINPVITIVEEVHKVERQTIKYKTEVIEDSSYYASYSEVVQKGINGESLVTQKIKLENGEIVQAIISQTEELTPAVNKIIKTGSKAEYVVGSTEYWGWPTRTPYVISDRFGWRWGKMHNAIDITGTGKGSPIYAVNDGTVSKVSYYSQDHNSLGNYIKINHHNGYITLYAHLQKVYVKVGQAVYRGDVIGTMGSTGYSTGTHLHFGVEHNGSYINPFKLYQ